MYNENRKRYTKESMMRGNDGTVAGHSEGERTGVSQVLVYMGRGRRKTLLTRIVFVQRHRVITACGMC